MHVIQLKDYKQFSINFAGTCLQSSIRLVGPNGLNTVEGRVEYCSNGVWGTVSSYQFDTKDGEVVCRKIGYQHPRKLASSVFGFSLCANLHCLLGVQIFSSSCFGLGTGPVLFTGLSCTGSEYSPVDCPQSNNAYDYSHGGDVGVRCLQKGSLMIVNIAFL